MNSRLRKLVGLAVLLPGLGAYLFAAALIGAEAPPHWWFQVPYYAAAGVLWAFPAIWLMKWMEGDKSRIDANGEETGF